MQAEKNALSAERKQLEQKLKNTETELIMVKNLKAQAELRCVLYLEKESEQTGKITDSPGLYKKVPETFRIPVPSFA